MRPEFGVFHFFCQFFCQIAARACLGSITGGQNPRNPPIFTGIRRDSNPGSGERQLAVSGNALDHAAIREGHIGSGQGFVVGAGANHRHTLTNHLHSPHAPDLINIAKEVREAQRSENLLALRLPMMLFLSRLEYSNLLGVVDQILNFASFLIE